MAIQNILLMETAEQYKPSQIIADMKKSLNVCALSKYKSEGECAKFYSMFFLSQTPENDLIKFEDWGNVYTVLLNDGKFCDNLALFIALYKPKIYEGMFRGLMVSINADMEEMTTRRILYLNTVKATLNMIQIKLDGIAETVKMQTTDQETIKFLTVIHQSLTQHIISVSVSAQQALADTKLPNTVPYNPQDDAELEDDEKELIETFENYDAFMSDRLVEPLDEGIVNNAKLKAKEKIIKMKRAQEDFDTIVMKKVKEMRANRRNRKHAEMVGESLRLSREIKRLLVAGGVGIVSPAVGVLLYIASIAADKATDVKDRQIIVGQLKDDLEIIEEKISMAERNGDDKAKVELIRLRQKLYREYERITRLRYDGSIKPNA